MGLRLRRQRPSGEWGRPLNSMARARRDALCALMHRHAKFCPDLLSRLFFVFCPVPFLYVLMFWPLGAVSIFSISHDFDSSIRMLRACPWLGPTSHPRSTKPKHSSIQANETRAPGGCGFLVFIDMDHVLCVLFAFWFASRPSCAHGLLRHLSLAVAIV